jgi:hypothetical protein
VVAVTAPDVEPLLVQLASLIGAGDFASQEWRGPARCRGTDPNLFPHAARRVA